MAAPLFDSNIIREAQEVMDFMANMLESSKHAFIRAIAAHPGADEFIGMLLRENRLSDGVFTAEKTQMTELLMLQASILLDNARLTEDLYRFKQSVN